MLQYPVSHAIRLISTGKDPTIGDVAAVSSAADLTPVFRGKRCLVVGGTRGIGRGIALALSRAGAGATVVVGRNTRDVAEKLKAIAPADSGGQTFEARSADLFTVSGAERLVQDLADSDKRPFGYVFFTVGCWPDYADPFTSEGVEKMVALDLVARHVVLKSLIKHGLLEPGARIMNTLAPTQAFPLQSVGGVKARLEESTQMVPPGRIPFSLMPVAVAADAWLRAMSKRHPDHKFVGMFPGLVATDVAATSFPPWMAPFHKTMHWFVSMSEEESGLAHVTIIGSENVGKHQISFFNHLLQARCAHPVAMDEELSGWVYDWLEKTIASL